MLIHGELYNNLYILQIILNKYTHNFTFFFFAKYSHGTAPNRGKCHTCPDKRCHAYHWCHKRYEDNIKINNYRWGKPEYNFKWYYLMNSTDLLYNVFLPRVEATSSSIMKDRSNDEDQDDQDDYCKD